jgi:hypothetical protein
VDCNDTSASVFRAVNGYLDADGDGYGTGALTTCVGATGTYVANNTDCNDASVSVFRIVNGYLDADGDGYGTGAITPVCSGSTLTSGYVANNTDCNDSTSWVYQTKNIANDWDYDRYSPDGPYNSYCVGTAYANPNGATYYYTIAGHTSNSGWIDWASRLGADCNDTSASVFRAVNGYLDADGDGYGTGTLTTCVGATGTYVASNADCYDANANAKPNSSYCSTANRGDGSFDYNCNNGSTACGTIYSGLVTAYDNHLDEETYGRYSFACGTTIGGGVACGAVGYVAGGGSFPCESCCSECTIWFSNPTYGGIQACN